MHTHTHTHTRSHIHTLTHSHTHTTDTRKSQAHTQTHFFFSTMPFFLFSACCFPLISFSLSILLLCPPKRVCLCVSVWLVSGCEWMSVDAKVVSAWCPADEKRRFCDRSSCKEEKKTITQHQNKAVRSIFRALTDVYTCLYLPCK